MAITGLNGGEWPTQELEPREVTDRPIIEYWARICQNTVGADDENCSGRPRDVDSFATIWSPSAAAGDLQTGELIDG